MTVNKTKEIYIKKFILKDITLSNRLSPVKNYIISNNLKSLNKNRILKIMKF